MKQLAVWHRAYYPKRRLFHVECATFTHAYKHGIHAHDFAEVFWVNEGSGIHLINRRIQPITMGNLCMIRPLKDAHTFKAHRHDFTIYYLAFPADILRDIRRRYFTSNEFWGGTGVLPKVYHLSASSRQWLNASAINLVKAPESRLILDRFLLNLLETTCELMQDPYRDCPSWLRETCAAIQQPNYFTQGTKIFTQLTRRPQSYIAHLLKKHTGKTPTDILNEARLSHAASLLLITSRTILDIALECGFQSLPYFYAIFHKIYGMPPRRYRNMHYKVPAHHLLPFDHQKST